METPPPPPEVRPEARPQRPPPVSESKLPGEARAARARPDDALQWSDFAFALDLGGIARQVVLNSIVGEFNDNRLVLVHLPELELMLKPDIKNQIKASVEAKLQVSLALEFMAAAALERETPQQAFIRRQEEERIEAIGRIREQPMVSRLNQLFNAELVEASVRKQTSQ